MARYRDKETGNYVSEATYNRSIAKGGTRYEKTDDAPDRIFGSLDAFDYDTEDYDDYEDLFYDGGADYGETE
jgi:hypothetical protein